MESVEAASTGSLEGQPGFDTTMPSQRRRSRAAYGCPPPVCNGLRVDRDYLDGGDLRLGYAATVHKYQGATCDRAYLLASDSLRRKLGYVGLSRGRYDNRIWTTSDRDPNAMV